MYISIVSQQMRRLQMPSILHQLFCNKKNPDCMSQLIKQTIWWTQYNMHINMLIFQLVTDKC